MKTENVYPDFFDSLPQADIPISVIEAKLLHGKEHQVVFFDVGEKSCIPPHSHSPQGGVVISGEMRLELRGKEFLLLKGDSYFIPENTEHRVEVSAGFKAVDIFFENARYNVKK